MTDEERRIITDYVQRVAGAAQPQARPSSPWGNTGTGQQGYGQAQAAPNLPPVDPEADRLIADLFSRYPEARYRLTQTAFVQEAALVQAQNRIQELEYDLEATRRQADAAPQRGGLFGGMFGGGGRQPAPMPPRPQPMQPPGNYDPRMLQQQQGRGGMGFMGTALTTAAGVAGGLVLGNALMGMMSGGGAAQAASAATGASDAGTGDFGQEAVATPASSPWTDPAGASQDASPVSDGGWNNDAQGGGWDDAQAGGFDDAGDGGFDDEV